MSDTLSKIIADVTANQPAPGFKRSDLQADDTVTLVIDGERISDWQEVSITRGMEVMPPQCQLALTFAAPGHELNLPDFASCEVYVGQDLLITGYVQRTTISVSARSHQIVLTVAGRCQDLVECSAITADRTQQVNDASIKMLADALCGPLGVQVVLEGSAGPVLPRVNVSMTDRVWDVLDSNARYAAKILIEDEAGRLVITDVGTTAMSSGFDEGINLESASFTFDASIRYSDYIAANNANQQFLDLGPLNTLEGDVHDDEVPRVRPLVVVSNLAMESKSFAVEQAKYEFARRVGRSQVLHIQTADWRDTAGKLWTINSLIEVELPSLLFDRQQMLISEVTFVRGLQGQHANVTLMPPSAFTVAPSTKGLIASDYAAATGGGTPSPAGAAPAAPPTTVRLNLPGLGPT